MIMLDGLGDKLLDFKQGGIFNVESGVARACGMHLFGNKHKNKNDYKNKQEVSQGKRRC
jgi:hypothetical protein